MNKRFDPVTQNLPSDAYARPVFRGLTQAESLFRPEAPRRRLRIQLSCEYAERCSCIHCKRVFRNERALVTHQLHEVGFYDKPTHAASEAQQCIARYSQRFSA